MTFRRSVDGACGRRVRVVDLWVGGYSDTARHTFIGSLLVFGLAEVVIFAWVFGMDRGWQEITRGAEIRVPGILRPVLKYVTPLFLATILLGFAIQSLGNAQWSNPWGDPTSRFPARTKNLRS